MIQHAGRRSRYLVWALVLSGCTDAVSPDARAGERVNAAVGYPSSTGCTVSLVQPSISRTEYPVNMPYSGTDCGVNYSISLPPFPPRIGFPYAQLVFRAPLPSPAGTVIYGFSSSYNNGSPQGVFQNGPMDFSFSQPVDRFVMEFDGGSCTVGGGCGTGMRRIQAFGDTGQLLADTMVLAPGVVDRLGMRRILLFADSTGVFGDLTTVVGGRYTIGFRPDSSCPPSGDKVLDSKQVRDAIYDAFANSGSPPNFVEHGGDIYEMSDGTYKAFPRPDPTATACSYSTISPANEPALPTGAKGRWAYFHSHAPEGSFVVGCTSGSGYVRNGLTGGLSPADWSTASSQGFYVYAYDGTRVWRADIGVNSTQWSKNPNRWKRNSKRCFIP